MCHGRALAKVNAFRILQCSISAEIEEKENLYHLVFQQVFGSKAQLLGRRGTNWCCKMNNVYTWTLFPLTFHPGSMGLISILISSLLFDTNKPARVVNKLFPKLSSLSQTFCLIERKNYQVKLQYLVSKVKKIIPLAVSWHQPLQQGVAGGWISPTFKRKCLTMVYLAIVNQ